MLRDLFQTEHHKRLCAARSMYAIREWYARDINAAQRVMLTSGDLEALGARIAETLEKGIPGVDR